MTPERREAIRKDIKSIEAQLNGDMPYYLPSMCKLVHELLDVIEETPQKRERAWRDEIAKALEAARA